MISALFALTLAKGLRAQVPTILTDKIYQGSGVINLLKDTSGSLLSQYLGANGRLLLGVDVNENAAGNETNASQGIAIQSVQLLITTNQGSYSFSDIFTNTTAQIMAEGGTTPQTYHTLFGRGGSSQINKEKGLSEFDDVLELRDVAVKGTIESAKLVVNFLQTNTTKPIGANEAFFDFSGGFEDFALLTPKDAQVLEAAAIGVTDASSALDFSTTSVQATYYTDPTSTITTTTTTPSTSSVVLSAPAAPEPPLVLALGGAGLALVVAARGRLARRA